jgi:hypothetical protein
MRAAVTRQPLIAAIQQQQAQHLSLREERMNPIPQKDKPP